MAWRETLLRRLREGANDDGSYGYGYRSRGAAEPTALAAMALSARGDDVSASRRWLAEVQRPDGGVPILDRMEGPCWPSALAALAWQGDDAFLAPADGALAWLSGASGVGVPRNDSVGHDTSLVAWSWTPDTHSWVEPTSYALLALGPSHVDERTDEAVRLLMDRQLRAGGWNYGNTRVLGSALRPFPATTGLALAALAGRPEVREYDDGPLRRSRQWLAAAVADIRAPLSLAWGLIGLDRWSAPLAGKEGLLEASTQADLDADPTHDALRLLTEAPGVLARPSDRGADE